MKCFKFILFSLLLLSPAMPVLAQDTEETIYDDESADLSYRQQDMFRLLDTPQFQLGLHAVTTPFSGQQSFGAALDMQMWYTHDLALGLSLTVTGRRVSPDYGYIIGQPLMMYYDFSLFNEFRMLQWKRFDAAFRLYTGFSAYKLADKSITEKYTWYTEDGYPMEGERPLTIDNNYFMRVAPALVLRYQISRCVQVEASGAYNFYVGGASYGYTSDFMNYQLQLGVKFGIH